MTNGNSQVLVAALNGAPKHSFTGLIIHKKGETRGKGADKKVYGNDLVHQTIITGFAYRNLVEKSYNLLKDLDVSPLTCDKLDKDDNPVTAEDFEIAKNELLESFARTLAGESESTTDKVFEPLVSDGKTVVGSRVYKCIGLEEGCRCRNCTGDPKAPLPGTIYLSGLKIQETILEPAANGPIPAAKSKATVLAKDVIRKLLPVRRYVSFPLEPGTDFILRIAGSEIEAREDGIVVNDEVTKLLNEDA